jgi:hypothetical protein
MERIGEKYQTKTEETKRQQSTEISANQLFLFRPNYAH